MFKVLSSTDGKVKFPGVPQKHLQWARRFSRRAAIIEVVLMYRDKLMDNPNHYHYVVLDDVLLRRHLLRAPSPLPQASYAKELIKRSIEARKQFDKSKADLRITKREYHDMHSTDVHKRESSLDSRLIDSRLMRG